jgi:hypothetical protein
LPICRLAPGRKHLWSCENDVRRDPCSSMLEHCNIHIEDTYRI